MNAPLVSVIVPVYNVAPYLEKCLDSILNQTFSDLEVILIDDGSTDLSAKICELHASRDKRIKFISKENEGQGATRNLGVTLAKGKYFIFLDPDDWLELDCIEELYSVSEELQIDIASCDINYVYQEEDGNCSEIVSRLRLESGKTFDAITDKSVINKARAFLCGKLFRADFYRNINLDQPAHPYEDMCIMPVLVAKARRMYHVQKPLFSYYRNRPGNTVDNFKFLPYILVSLHELVDNFKRFDLFEFYREELKMLSYSHVRVALNKMKNADPDNEEAIELRRRLYTFMDNNFPEWVNLFEKKLIVIGNLDIKKALLNLIVNGSQITFYHDCEMIEGQSDTTDYIFFDSFDAVVESEAQRVVCLVNDTNSDEDSSLRNTSENILVASVTKCDNKEDESWYLSDEIFRIISG